jgi:4-hydroxysphinganine ceramide fatty acyl 2-hydroxylase
MEDVAVHKSLSSCWVSRNDKVYDVTGFLPDHPGGDDLILKYGGQDIGDVMKNPDEHVHSESAYDMLDEFLIGRVGTDAGLVDEGTSSHSSHKNYAYLVVDWVAEEDFHPDDTDADKDYAQNEFLDLRKPLLRQLWDANFSKSYYLLQVHQPRHLAESARLFGPGYLEVCCRLLRQLTHVLTSCLQVFTKAAWYVVPIFWLPITTYLFCRSLLQFTLPAPLPAWTEHPYLPVHLLMSVPTSSIIKTLSCFFTGNLIWTILEYTLHRFLFHVDYYLPDRPAFLLLHFLLHGVHHYLPMDRCV